MHLYAIDRATGPCAGSSRPRDRSTPRPRWRTAWSTPAASTGSSTPWTPPARRKWTFATKGERRFTALGIHGAMPSTERMPDPFDVFLSSPVVAGGTVIFGSGDQHVHALEALTGALKWSFATGDVVHASPAVASGVVYMGAGTGTSMPSTSHRDASAGGTRPATTPPSTTRSASQVPRR